MKYLWKTYRQGKWGGVDVHGFFTQPSGVLEGQTLKRFIDNYPTLEAAQAAHPDAKGGHALLDPVVSLNHLSDEGE